MSPRPKHLHLVDPQEIEQQARKEALLIEAGQHGYAVDLSLDLEEIEDQVQWMREERQGKPPCFKRSFRATSPYCKICDLNTPCGIDHRREESFLLSGVDSEPCEVCGVGFLQIELVDPQTGQVRNYACSHMGCYNTALDQRRFHDEQKLAERAAKKAKEARTAQEKKPPKTPKRTTTRRKLDLDSLAVRAAQFMRENGGTLLQVKDLIGCLQITYASTNKVLDFMLEQGMVRKLIKPGDEERKKPRYIYQIVKDKGETPP